MDENVSERIYIEYGNFFWKLNSGGNARDGAFFPRGVSDTGDCNCNTECMDWGTTAAVASHPGTTP